MFKFDIEALVPLVTVTRNGFWSLDTVALYETALRAELEKLQSGTQPTGFIIDVRSSGAQARDVAEALRSVVSRLGPLNADRTAVVTSSGVAKLQARHIADSTTQIFTSMALAREWVTGGAERLPIMDIIHDEPSDATPEGPAVHIHGPADLDIALTPTAALETARRISDAAIEVIVGTTAPPGHGVQL